MGTSVVLFTRDLRLHDHPALAAAVHGSETVVPLFVVDDPLISGRAGTPNRLAFLLASLHDLDDSLRKRGSRLAIRRGDWVEEASRFAGAAGAETIFLSEDVSGYARARQRRLEHDGEKAGLAVRAFEGVTVIPPGEVTPANGDHYRVFTPYWNAWRRAGKRDPLPAPRKLRSPSRLRWGSIPKLS
ncbi:MAG TPA: deoxyribodipyrimidine photo-lyase, partial [Solirubrobacterales bacterium]|nr:deoxyribodipyrimidine photo-lyase [Solirubrobacterales bacterium]